MDVWRDRSFEKTHVVLDTGRTGSGRISAGSGTRRRRAEGVSRADLRRRAVRKHHRDAPGRAARAGRARDVLRLLLPCRAVPRNARADRGTGPRDWPAQRLPHLYG